MVTYASFDMKAVAKNAVVSFSCAKKVFLLLVGLFLFVDAFAQLNEGGTPYSFTDAYKKEAAGARVKDIPVVYVDAPDLEKLYAEDEKSPLHRIGVGMKLKKQVNVQEQEGWAILANGDRLWKMKFTAPDAVFLIPFFEDFTLPVGARLFMYNCNGESIRGAYTHRNNNTYKTFNTIEIQGNCIVVEYFEPASVKGKGTFVISSVTYGYKKKQ